MSMSCDQSKDVYVAQAAACESYRIELYCGRVLRLLNTLPAKVSIAWSALSVIRD
jgi:hypothetical protein